MPPKSNITAAPTSSPQPVLARPHLSRNCLNREMCISVMTKSVSTLPCCGLNQTHNLCICAKKVFLFCITTVLTSLFLSLKLNHSARLCIFRIISFREIYQSADSGDTHYVSETGKAILSLFEEETEFDEFVAKRRYYHCEDITCLY